MTDTTREKRGLAVVTGAAVRVGRAIALHLADEGYDIVAHAHGSFEKLATLAQEIESRGCKCYAMKADLSDLSAVQSLGKEIAEKHGVVDVVVHNAALFEKLPFDQIDESTYRRMMAVNLDAPFFLTQALLPALRKASAPVVVHVVDIGADRPLSKHAHYSLSKAGLSMLTRALAVELAPHIRVVGVAPGAVQFPEWYSPETREKIVQRVPLQREGSPADVASAVGFLVRSSYLTGCMIPVDGGRHVVF